jgi:superoxide dismutase
MEKTVRPLKYTEIKDFLSERQLKEHHDVLYVGYIKKINELRQKITQHLLLSEK